MTEYIKETLKKSNNDLDAFVHLLSLEELNFVLNRYCGPHNLLLREKLFKHNSKKLQRLINDEIAYRLIDDILLSDETL